MVVDVEALIGRIVVHDNRPELRVLLEDFYQLVMELSREQQVVVPDSDWIATRQFGNRADHALACHNDIPGVGKGGSHFLQLGGDSAWIANSRVVALTVIEVKAESGGVLRGREGTDVEGKRVVPCTLERNLGFRRDMSVDRL